MSFDKKAYMDKWRAANRERIRANDKAWRDRHPGRDKTAQKEWTAANRERVNNQALAWYRRNKATVLANVRRRQARQKAAACNCCAPISFRFIYLQARSLKMEVDHVQPLSKGGKHCLRNLQLLERHANRVKHAKWEPNPMEAA